MEFSLDELHIISNVIRQLLSCSLVSEGIFFVARTRYMSETSFVTFCCSLYVTVPRLTPTLKSY